MASIAVVGAGAIGGIVATRLAQSAEHEVTVAVRTPVADLAVECEGVTLRASPRVLTSVDDAAPVDWVLVATKSYDAAGAATWFDNLVGPKTRVAVLQNGVEHVTRFSAFVDAVRIVPVIVDIPAERAAPGRYIQHRKGLLTVADSEDGRAFAALFGSVARGELSLCVTTDFTTVAWKKLCVNAPGAVSTWLLGTPDMTEESHASLVRGVLEETVAVGRAEGAVLDDAVIDEVLDGFRNARPGGMNSMHADRAAGRPMELDARNGVIVRLGEVHGIPTPTNRWIVEQLVPEANGSARG